MGDFEPDIFYKLFIPLDVFLKKSREAHSKVAEVFQSIMNDDPTFRKRNSTWVE